VIDKPAGVIVFPERKITKKTLIDFLIENFSNLKDVGKPPRYGIIHRLDKDTSGVLLIAKNNQALSFFQKQFKEKAVIKKYLALVVGRVKENQGEIETLIGRDPKKRIKQKVYLLYAPESKKKGLRRAITEYKVIKRFKNYTLLEVLPKTGRKHQIRCHLAFLSHPIAGDKIYKFKNQPKPKGLERHFLHAASIKIKLPNKSIKEFKSKLPKNLQEVLENLER
jgi:23S rRNA pseudouridine1911/1915/1917 synthase